jgi:hypothetical protein
MNTGDVLKQAIAAARTGNKGEARKLLGQLLRHDSDNETAWLWLSGVVETDEQRVACLEKVLTLNPDNTVAQRGLERTRTGQPKPSGTEDPAARPQASRRAGRERDPASSSSAGEVERATHTNTPAQTPTPKRASTWEEEEAFAMGASSGEEDGREAKTTTTYSAGNRTSARQARRRSETLSNSQTLSNSEVLSNGEKSWPLGEVSDRSPSQVRRRSETLSNSQALSNGESWAALNSATLQDWDLAPRPDVPDLRPKRADGVKVGGRSSVDTMLRVVAAVLVLAVVGILGYVVVTWAAEELPKVAESSGSGDRDAAQPQWQQVASREGHFFCVMPGSPKAEVQNVSTMVGNLALHAYTVELDDAAYIVGYTDYPESLVRNADVQAMLDGARDGAISNVGGRLVGERQIRLQGNPGREVWLEATVEGQTALAQLRVYLVGTRLYQTLVAGPKESFSKSDAEKFLNSFILVN